MTKPKMKYECSTVVLDLDGTISDPSLGITRCFNHALESHGFPAVEDSIIEKEIGPPLDETFIKLAPGITSSNVTPLVSTYRERYSEIGYSENTLYPGIASALDKIVKSGLSLGVCTSKRRDFAERILSLFNLINHFNFVDGGNIGVTKKSQLANLKDSGVIDTQAIMIGDRAVDIVSAHENGLRSMGVLWGFGSYTELSDVSPMCLLEKVEELPNAII